jgi:bla regulator protein BlaR1
MISASLSPIEAHQLRGLSEHLWQSTLFTGVVAVLVLLLRKNQARIRYWLWMAASIKFLIPLSLLVSVGSHLPWPHYAAPKTGAYLAIEEMSLPILEVTTLDAPITVLDPKPITPHVPIRILPLILEVFWLTGFFTMMSFWSVQWWRIFRLVCAAKPLTDGREADLLRKTEQSAGLRRSVPLLSSSYLM